MIITNQNRKRDVVPMVSSGYGKNAEKREVFSFNQDVPKSSTVTLEQKVYKDARVKYIRADFIDGEDGDLHVTVWGVGPSGEALPIDLVNYIGDTKYWSGNARVVECHIDIPIRANSMLYVRAENVDDTYTYPLMAQIDVEYMEVE